MKNLLSDADQKESDTHAKHTVKMTDFYND